MSIVKAGTRVRITEKTKHYHDFQTGSIAVSLGVGLNGWTKFKLEGGGPTDLQYLLPEHYEVIADSKAVLDVPSKAVYAVTNATDEIMATTADREYARDLKAALGGKRKGVKIFKYEAVKEIR